MKAKGKQMELKLKSKSSVKFYKKEGFQAYLFMLPTLIGFPLLCAYPMLYSLYCSFTNWNGITKPEWAGLKNYIHLFTKDPVFFKSLRVTLTYALINVPITLVLGLALAVLLNKKLPGIKFFRVAYYLPTIVPAVAAIVLWQFIFKSDSGLLNGVLATVGIKPIGWLTESNMVLISLSIIKWWGVGGMMIIFLSGLQSVPVDIYEAAVIDGASGWKKFSKITLPLITPILFLQLITGTIGAFQVFSEAMIMTKGGPNYSSNFINYDIYQTAFNSNKFGRACAEAWVLFVIILIFTVFVFRKSEQFVYYENE
jgi:ABC-type sugar transport system permease subunit